MPSTSPADAATITSRGHRPPSDDVGATLTRSDGIRGQRYGEIVLIGTDAATGHQVGGVYNTTGLNHPSSDEDSCPQQLWDKIDTDALTKEHDILGAIKNGPRLWCLDWLEAMTGAERDFAGLKTRWVAWLDVTNQLQRQRATAYSPTAVRRDTRFGIDAGSPALTLNDPDANSWVLKSVNVATHSTQTYEDLSRLGSLLRLPPGWTFRAVVLDADLVLTPRNGTAPVIADDLGNVYDRAGGPFSNYQP